MAYQSATYDLIMTHWSELCHLPYQVQNIPELKDAIEIKGAIIRTILLEARPTGPTASFPQWQRVSGVYDALVQQLDDTLNIMSMPTATVRNIIAYTTTFTEVLQEAKYLFI